MSLTPAFHIDGCALYNRAPKVNMGRQPILFVHGACAWSWYWENFLSWFAGRSFPAYAIDLRGHGQSLPVRSFGRLSIDDYRDDVLGVVAEIAKRDGAPPVLVGHSMGGLVAARAAERTALSGLVLLAPAPPSGVSMRLGRTAKLDPRDLLHATSCAFTGEPYLPSERVMKFGLPEFAGTPRMKEITDRLVPESPSALVEIGLGSVRVDPEKWNAPAFMIAGENDPVILPEIAARIAARYKIELDERPGAGHLFMIEDKWKEHAHVIYTWIREHAGTRSAPRK